MSNTYNNISLKQNSKINTTFENYCFRKHFIHKATITNCIAMLEQKYRLNHLHKVFHMNITFYSKC